MTIWMVERKQGEIWVPQMFAHTSRLATAGRKAWKKFNPSDKFRVRKYSRVEETQ